MSQRILQAHCQSPTSQPARQSFVKELAKLTQRKIELKKIPSLLKIKKYANAQTNSTQTMTVKLNNDNGLQQRTDRRPTGNMRLASCGVKCLNSSAVFQINFSAGLTVLCPEIPHERQAQKRWLQC